MAATNVVYYWVVAQLIQDYIDGKQSTGGKIMTWLAVLHNIIYMMLNHVLFYTETGFY